MPVFGDGMERGKYLHHMYQISILAYRVPVWPVGGIRGVGSESDLFYVADSQQFSTRDTALR